LWSIFFGFWAVTGLIGYMATGLLHLLMIAGIMAGFAAGSYADSRSEDGEGREE